MQALKRERAATKVQRCSRDAMNRKKAELRSRAGAVGVLQKCRRDKMQRRATITATRALYRDDQAARTIQVRPRAGESEPPRASRPARRAPCVALHASHSTRRAPLSAQFEPSRARPRAHRESCVTHSTVSSSLSRATKRARVLFIRIRRSPHLQLTCSLPSLSAFSARASRCRASVAPLHRACGRHGGSWASRARPAPLSASCAGTGGATLRRSGASGRCGSRRSRATRAAAAAVARRSSAACSRRFVMKVVVRTDLGSL